MNLKVGRGVARGKKMEMVEVMLSSFGEHDGMFWQYVVFMKNAHHTYLMYEYKDTHMYIPQIHMHTLSNTTINSV